VAHLPRKKPLDFRSNPNHVTLGLAYYLGMVRVTLGLRSPYSAREDVTGACLIVTVLRH